MNPRTRAEHVGRLLDGLAEVGRTLVPAEGRGVMSNE
jgi:hypothetical protein